MSAGLDFKCSECGGACYSRLFSLCRNEERTVAVSPTVVETITSDSREVDTFCHGCGRAAAVRKLLKLGLEPARFDPDASTFQCCRCGDGPLPLDVTHVAYVVTEDYVDGCSIQTNSVELIAPVCQSCQAPLLAAIELAQLEGTRLAVSTELEVGPYSPEVLKKLTGDELLRTRDARKDSSEGAR